MDELALLRDFRLEDAAAGDAREYARAALKTAMTRRRLPRRRYALVLAFAVAALLAAAAYAIVHQFVIGTAAPKDVQDQVGLHLALGAQAIPYAGESHKAKGPALIAAGAQTSVGPVYLLRSRLEGGGECQFVWYERLRTPKDLPITSGTCEFGKRLHRPFGYAFEGGTARDGHQYQLIEGYAPGAVRMRIGTRFYKTPFGWFIAEYLQQDRLTAWGAHGGVVARVKLSPSGPAPRPHPPVKPTTPLVPTGRPDVFVSTQMGWVQAQIRVTPAGRSFKWLYTHQPLKVSVSPNNKGGVCIFVDVDPTRLVEPHCTSRPEANELQAFPTPLGWTRSRHGPSWVQGEAVLGKAGENISHVDVRFSDGSTAPAALRRGAIFYLIPRPHYAVGHRPVELVGRDASGNVVARKHLPFAR